MTNLREAKGGTTLRTVEKSSRIIYFDMLNIAACFAVIMLHHSGIVHAFPRVTSFDWTQALVVESLFFWAVPVFLMLTGATLMRYRDRYSTKTFFKKRLLRVLLPYVIWSVAIVFFRIVQGEIEWNGVRAFLNSLITNGHISIFWFFPVIISIYCAMPVLSLLSRNRSILWYIVGFGLVTYSLLPPIFAMAGLTFNDAYRFPITGGGFIIFVILGYLISTAKISKKNKAVIYLMGASAIVFRFLMIFLLSTKSGEYYNMLNNYVYLTGVLPAIAVFVLFKEIKWQMFIKNDIAKEVVSVSSCSLGIYIIHILVMSAELQVTGLSPSGEIWRLISPIVTYLICLTIVFAAKKVPIVRHLFP